MRQFFKILLVLCCVYIVSFSSTQGSSVDQNEIFSTMKMVTDWQINDFANNSSRPEHKNWMWTNAVFYIGMERFAQLNTNDKYYRWLDSIASAEYYRPGPRVYFADDLAVIQLYVALYRRDQKRDIILPSKARLEWIVDHPSENKDLWITGRANPFDRWVWCDALFMAPPAFAAMGNLLNDPKFSAFVDREFGATRGFLFDASENLFYRDHRYFDQKEANGEKIFWGRGNGWVVAGIALLLEQLSADDPSVNLYIDLYKKLSQRILSLQNPNGMWHPSLLDPVSYSQTEASASALCAFALAWGINHGILDAAKYRPAVDNAWNALKQCIHSDGKLGFVQPIGADPKKVSYDQSEVYGVGAFLLFAHQYYLASSTSAVIPCKCIRCASRSACLVP